MKNKTKFIAILFSGLFLLSACGTNNKWGKIDPGKPPKGKGPVNDGELVQDSDKAKEQDMDEQVIVSLLDETGKNITKDFTYIKTEDNNVEYLLELLVKKTDQEVFPNPIVQETEDGKNLMLFFPSTDPFLPFFASNSAYNEVRTEIGGGYGIQETPLEYRELFYRLYDETIKENFPEYENIIYYTGDKKEDLISPNKDGVIFPA